MKIAEIYKKYIRINSFEKDSFSILETQLNEDQDVTSRSNFEGHVTASAFIVNEKDRQVLLIEHKVLKKYLQPGGHIEPQDKTPLHSAVREAEEETGISSKDLNAKSIAWKHPVIPFDIDTHFIPENPKKGEPSHYHHDFRYLFTTKSSNVHIDKSESTDYRWIEWEEFSQLENFAKISDKIDALLESNTLDFFRSVVVNEGKKISVVAVSHIIPSSEDYIRSLQENFNLIGVIPKPKSINPSTLRTLENLDIPLLPQFTRESLTDNPDNFIEYLSDFENIVLIDIGGYFSNIPGYLKSELQDRLLGIVEDTENGLKKYETTLSSGCKVVSVARSPLKNYEDRLVGHSVAHATETILRNINILPMYKNCGVIGYGKVGKGIVEYLQQSNIKPYVCEIDPFRAVQSSNDGASVKSLNDLLGTCEIIFCATGAHSLNVLQLSKLKKGAYLASVTSSDDEFDFEFLEDEYEKIKVTEHVTKYVKPGHAFHLLNDGNAVNFLFSAAVDKYISLVQAELLLSAVNLYKGKYEQTRTVFENSVEEQANIANIWLQFDK